ncbi:MAG: peptidylprolyl isomerase [Gemmatimonadaceae bacterium]|jgi:cyclophilin family peptidyl-prolyl cis-trans isomerase|nr:peptidylprolyl isomerase [Gemmatimonadaceae bacterium]MCC6242018.1 peptidylprolyl isomerase [Gemmatimonadaceae bacterium]
MWLFLSAALLAGQPASSAPSARQAPAASAPRPTREPTRAPTAYDVLRAEHARGGDTGVLDAALASGDTLLQRLAVRAYGRWERVEYAARLTPMLRSPSVSVRRETLNALAQMGATIDIAAVATGETEPSVRAAMFEAIGRAVPRTAGAPPSGAAPNPAILTALLDGLGEPSLVTRTGAARGLESLLRRTARTSRPAATTVSALRSAFQDDDASEIRQLLLLGLTAAGDRDSATLAVALRDTSAQVRRLAVALSRQWINDPSPMVRYQALRVAGDCGRAAAAVRDANMHVVLTAIDVMAEKKCSAERLDSLVTKSADWRVQTRALVALARLDSVRARAALPRLVTSPVWQARAWVAQAAKLLKDSATLRTLARDAAPNVAIAAMTSVDDAMRGLSSNHSGLVLASATRLKGDATLATRAPALATALLRLSAARTVTNRDPRMELLRRLNEAADSATAVRLLPLVRDPDSEVAQLAAQVVSQRAHRPTTAATTRYTPAPFPAEATLRALRGATATIRLRSLGAFEIALLPDDAPATVAAFAALAERGAFNGLTWHRIVPNFVLQGGSPGADEYDGITTTFMRDETGFARHARGTFGISTRGRDTGDGQLFINLVDNFRLDHDYTVFATMVRGFDVMDRVQEGDVIESIVIHRRK